jgi:hypothetical protein
MAVLMDNQAFKETLLERKGLDAMNVGLSNGVNLSKGSSWISVYARELLRTFPG